ncbi:MAG: methyltransferase domain-containing protein [Euryarchaeota archaeon]|nr:methyltransferase domain-containing protein [Euryarchaeota archaeon]
MHGIRGNLVFRRVFGDAFPSSSDLAIDLCRKGGVSSSSQLIHLGSGLGSVSSIISQKFGCAVSGVEVVDKLVESSSSEWTSSNLEFQCAQLDSAPFPDAWGTHILIESRLSSSTNPHRILNEANRLLSDGGTMMSSEIIINDEEKLHPTSMDFLARMRPDFDYSLSSWNALLESNDFDVLQMDEEPRIMKNNATKLRRALLGARLLRRTGRLNLNEFGLGEFEDNFDEIASRTLQAMESGAISYASFISKRF